MILSAIHLQTVTVIVFSIWSQWTIDTNSTTKLGTWITLTISLWCMCVFCGCPQIVMKLIPKPHIFFFDDSPRIWWLCVCYAKHNSQNLWRKAIKPLVYLMKIPWFLWLFDTRFRTWNVVHMLLYVKRFIKPITCIDTMVVSTFGSMFVVISSTRVVFCVYSSCYPLCTYTKLTSFSNLTQWYSTLQIYKSILLPESTPKSFHHLLDWIHVLDSKRL